MPLPGQQYPTNSIPLWDDGDEITCRVGAGLLPGSRFVAVTGQPADAPDNPVIGACPVNGRAFGVSAFDGDAAGATAPDVITVWHAPHKVVEVTASGAIAAGVQVASTADGRATAFAGAAAGTISQGIAVFDAADGEKAFVDRSVGAGQIHA